jgi:DNA polymerase III subunit gamma/tau
MVVGQIYKRRKYKVQSNIDYRPVEFSEIVGNKMVVDTLTAFFERKSLPHTLLFTGSAGCGKTTFARIVCNKLDCSEEDTYEINMSNNRGIDTARDIIKNAYLKPMLGKVKVYIFDEVHKATNEFQNAMLKLLEEPPEHLYFILCTTDPSKLLKTVISRCTLFEVNTLGDTKMSKLLEEILLKKKSKLTRPVIQEIIKKAEGVPRDALIILDQVANLKSEEVQISAVKKIKLEESEVIELCRALLEGKKWKIVSGILKNLKAEPEQIRRAVLGYFTKVLLGDNQNNSVQAALVIDAFKGHVYDSGMAGVVLACYSLQE